ncbi:MAG: S8 family serine peptidase [Acidobacteriota bacterium]
MKRPKLPTARARTTPPIFDPRASAGEVTSETTGRYIIIFRDGAVEEGRRLLESVGFIVANADDTAEGILREEDAVGADVLIFPRVEMALLSGEEGQYEKVHAVGAGSDPNSPVLSVNPETVVYAAGKSRQHDSVAELDAYLHGYSDAVHKLIESLRGGVPTPSSIMSAAAVERFAFREDLNTWGLQATRVVNSRFTGRGIRLAVLDSGLDFNHRDFRGRVDPMNTISFVEGSDVLDHLGHGTHCAGIACGPARAAEGPRYGVAPDVGVHIGKVINDNGIGAKSRIIAGIDWAIKKGCQVISISIEEDVSPGEPFKADYENAGRRALLNSALVIASAGNGSNRRLRPARPVSAPANSPSIIAVGSVGQTAAVSTFSNGGVNPNGGEVNIAAPGESIHSSFRSDSYFRDSGTSQATPLLAGIAALFAEADSTARGQRLVTLLQQFALNVGANPVDVGAGVVQAPN